jgi:hypothetical protein
MWIAKPGLCCSGLVRRRAFGWLILAIAAVCAASAGACRRRRAHDGVCAAHIDCDRGYDCRDGLCVKRPPVPGSEAARVVTPRPTPAPAAAPPGESPPRQEETPAAPSPKPRPPPANYAPPLDPTLPMWKARLKNS